MTLELLICTIDDGIHELKEHLLALRADVSYLISWQYSGERPKVPDWIHLRSDVRLLQLSGRGLCRNRNHALEHATGDILKICDDDETWTDDDFDIILDTYRQHPEYDVVHFQVRGAGKAYPPRFVSSVELTLRRDKLNKLRFDERFGLGSPCLNACEEDVFICDARRMGLSVHYVPRTICEINGQTTGDDITNPLLQRSKGAAFYRNGGLLYAYYKSVRETVGWMLRRRINPIPMLYNMLWGINYIRTWHP